MSDSTDIEAAMRRKERLANLLVGFFVVAAIATFFGLFFGHQITAFFSGESDIWGDRAYQARYEGKLGDIEVDRVHSELFPGWVIAAANVSARGGEAYEEQAWQALSTAIAADKNLLEIATELREKAIDDPVKHVERLYYLTWAWTKYLDENGIGYVIQSNVTVTSRNQFFYAKVYDTLARLDVSVAGKAYPARIVRRVDQTNIREQYLGATSKGEHGATVVVDRVLEFAMGRVWPALNPENDASLDPLSAVWAGAMRKEAAAALSPDALAVLRETAADRKAIVEAVDAIHKRHECGARFVINDVPWYGLGTKSREQIRHYGERAGDHPCPDVKLEEADAIDAASESLVDADGLEDAVREMVFWLAKPIAIHEGRHVADDATVNGLEEPLDCEACGEEMPAVARAELSSYLASFAWSASPNTAFFQACDATEGIWGAHGMAMGMILDEIGRSCEDGPPPGLVQTARRLEAEWLGRAQPVTLGHFQDVANAALMARQ